MTSQIMLDERTALVLGRPLSPLKENPDWDDFEILASYKRAHGFSKIAIELWRLAGRDDRAEALDTAMLNAYDYDPPRLDRERIIALRDALDGLDEALVGPVIDEEHFLSMEKVTELRGKTEALDLDESRGDLARHAVMEALVYVHHLRDIANDALEADAQILID